jgi:hypothetical protein
MSRINIMVANFEADRRPAYLEQKLGHGLYSKLACTTMCYIEYAQVDNILSSCLVIKSSKSKYKLLWDQIYILEM